MSLFASALEEPRQVDQQARRRHTVLIIDDDDALTDVLSSRLRKQGYDTLAAESGQAGLDLARSSSPDLILLDLRLPDADGFSICAQLADLPETCTIPVIILSGLDRPDILRRCRAAGCHYFLRKPYDPNALLILIRQAIDDAQGWHEAF